MISIARTFGAPLTVPAGSVARSTSIGPRPGTSVAGDLRREVHHVAVALQRQQLVDVYGAEPGDAADVVAGQVDEHHVLGALLGMFHELGGEAPVVLVGAAAACACRRSAGEITVPSTSLHHRLG